MSKVFNRWGLSFGPLRICWLDLWNRSWGLEISWRERGLVNTGFGKKEKHGNRPSRQRE